MPLEFALRPRIRLREDPAPPAPSRRSRLRVPRFALPAALYWAVVGGICYGIIRLHDAPAAEPAPEARELATEPELASVALPATDTPATQAMPVHEAAPEEAAPSVSPPAITDAPVADEPPAPAPRTHALGDDVSAALLASRSPEPARELVATHRALSQHQDQVERESRNALDAQAPSEAEPRPAPAPVRAGGSSLPSCEAAAAAAVQDMDFASSDRTADLPSEAIAGVLENGAWFSSCALPSSTKLDVCVAIKGGRVTAATVTSRPSDPALNACVKQRAAALQFPYSTRVDVARTRF